MTATAATYLGRPAGEWLALLNDPDPVRRRLGAYAVGEIGAADPDVVEALRGATIDPVSFVRVWAAAALARVSPGDPAVLPTLVTATADERHFVRSLAAWQLGRLGGDVSAMKEALTALDGLTGDDDASVRVEAALALRRLGRGGPAVMDPPAGRGSGGHA